MPHYMHGLQSQEREVILNTNSGRIGVSRVISERDFLPFVRDVTLWSFLTGGLVLWAVLLCGGQPHAERPTAQLTWPDRRHLIHSQGCKETDGAKRKRRSEREIRLTMLTVVKVIRGQGKICFFSSIHVKFFCRLQSYRIDTGCSFHLIFVAAL